MSAVLVVSAVALLTLVVVLVRRSDQLADNFQQVRTQLSDREAQLHAIIGPENAHQFSWDVAANRVRTLARADHDDDRSGRDLHDVFRALHPDDARRVQNGFGAITDGASDALLEEVRYRVDSDAKWSTFVVSARATRDRKGTATELRGLALDLSPFREAQAAAGQSEQRFRALAEAMPQIVYVNSRDGVEYINARWSEYTGCATADTEELRQVVHPDDIDALLSAWAVALETEGDLTVEFRLRGAADGAYRWFLTRAVPIRGDAGTVLRWYGTSTDIDEVRAARRALEELDRRKDEFLATLAHELRNPLAPIRNAITILQLSKTKAELPWALGLVDRQVQQMTRLIDDLMDVSRINEGKLELQLAPLDLRTVVADAVEMCNNIIGLGDHIITVESPDVPITMRGDAARLAQVVANLVNNAVKYSDPGTNIRIQLAATASSASIEVRDDGIGLPAEQLDAIFGMFTQVADSVYRSKGGLGIGLSLVRRLVEMHGGSVRAESDGEGRGSTFSITLPISEDALPVSDAVTNDAADAARKLRVLLVDDNVDAAESLAALLEMRGATVRTEHHGLDVIPAAREFSPQVIVLDIGLPGADGYDVCRMIRTEPWGKRLPLVALTGWGQDYDREMALQAGFDRHLAKPAHPDELMRVIGELTPMM